MLATSGGFVAICPKKEVELGADRLIHRADHAEELRQEIEFPCSKAVENQYALKCGGALRAINPNSSMTMAEVDTCAAVFKGNLFNKAELALQLVGCPPQLNEAQLLLHLYAAKGLDMLGMLQGQYAFCLYDSKQARVLAARDHSGAVPLVEGRTAAGSLIIACGTFLPEGVHQMVDIQPGEYKYGWHALPRQFKCGSHKIVSGRASCDYGIRRRSIDAFNASPCAPNNTRGKSLDIPGRQHHGSSSSGSHTPGRYVPPHSAGGFYSRSRATSLDSGHWGSHHPVSSSLPSPQAHNFGGRRRTSENNGHNGSASGAPHQSKDHSPKQHQQQQQQHHAAKPAPSPAAAVPAPMHAPAAAAKAAAAALAAAAAATSTPAAPASSSGKQAAQAAPLQVAIPAAAAANALSPGSEGVDGSQASTPMSAGADLTSPHRRKRRHRSRKNKGNSPAVAGSVDAGASSDTESQISTSTHDSANSAPPAAANSAAAGAGAATPTAGKAKSAPVPVPAGGGRRKSEAGSSSAGKGAQQCKQVAHSAGAVHDKPHGRGHHNKQQHHQQQWQPKAKQQEQQGPAAPEQRRRSSSGAGGAPKRNGSCGELAALGSSPQPRPVLQAAPQGLAC